MKCLRADRGSATLWALALIFVLLMGGLLALAVGQLAMTRQQVGTAMDLAAIAGAQALGEPCERVLAVAAANGALLMACSLDGGDVVVSGRVPAPAVVQRLMAFVGRPEVDVWASARAGQPEQ